MEPSSSAHVLVIAHRTAATPALVDVIAQRAERSPAHFHLLVPNPAPAEWHPFHPRRREQVAEAERVLALALPLFEHVCGGRVDGSVSIRHDPMDAIEEALNERAFDEIIISTLPRGVSRWLHVDLPSRVAHLGLPLTTVTAGDRKPADPEPAKAPAPRRRGHRPRLRGHVRHAGSKAEADGSGRAATR
jgi:hypothetical protein